MKFPSIDSSPPSTMNSKSTGLPQATKRKQNNTSQRLSFPDGYSRTYSQGIQRLQPRISNAWELLLMFKSLKALSTRQITLQWIGIKKTNCAIHWIEIYPLVSVIQLFNNGGVVNRCLSDLTRLTHPSPAITVVRTSRPYAMTTLRGEEDGTPFFDLQYSPSKS